MSGAQFVGVISLVLCLILVWGNVQSLGMSRESKLRMAGAWGAIIIVLTLLVSAFSA